MKKSYNPITDVRSEGVDVTRRLYRAISDVVRHLDDSRGRAEVCSDLFTATLEAQRMKLREYCERLIFSDPVGYGRKGEELLWKKGYYDVVTTAKNFRREQNWSDTEVSHIKNHLLAGVGHYHHLLFRLQTEFRLDLEGLVDFPLFVNTGGLPRGKSSSHKKTQDSLYVEWAKEAAHRCLIYLGDLSRYLLDLRVTWDSGVAQRYYLQALNMKCDVGMPHNQLGTIAGSRTWSLDAAYHYMRCLMCAQSFEGAEGNLTRLLERNAQWLHRQSQWDEGKLPPQHDHVRLLLAQFLELQELWFFCRPATADVHQLCHQTMRDLQHCLSYEKLAPCDADVKEGEELLEHTLAYCDSQDLAPDHVSDTVLFRMVVMMLMCICRLQAGGSQQVSVAIAFLTAIFNYLVEKVIDDIQESAFIIPLPPIPPAAPTPEVNGVEGEAEVATLVVECEASQDMTGPEATDCNQDKSIAKSKAKPHSWRRRRRRRLNSSEDSDLSEGETPYGENSSSENEEEELNSDISEGIELNEVTSSEDEEDTDESLPAVNGVLEEKAVNGVQLNGTQENGTRMNGDGRAESVASSDDGALRALCPDTAELVGVLLEEGLLQPLKVCCDWLRGDADVVRACSRTLRSLVSRVVRLLNLLAIDTDALGKVVDESCVKNLTESFPNIPLPEDVELHGLAILKTSHEALDWEYTRRHQLSTKEEVVVRALKLRQFGHFLVTVPESGVSYDKNTKCFVVSQEPVKACHIDKEKGKDCGESAEAGSGDEQSATPRGQLMHHMGQLWLRAEVRDLESRLRRRGAAFSPYLAVDCDALIHHMHLVKQLVAARRFILLIPNAVVSALDKLKREVGRARETIRWLEVQFQRGNRFLRAQRAHEQAPLPLIKYPKKKDREAWLFFQIVECCHYFSKQTGVHETPPETALVTLLTGQRAEPAVSRGFSPVGVAKSAGINLEHIETFHAKWKASSKSHG
ncbi:nonsense-mediated mRNA decay factor SMG5 [Bacillus rossius redtenbacheri]|uniref:nonsense-mediated mRNA decay factor SMG5 n=1 Tax=Bacillus rossius redtenbacheri TaxID=93214 RepID=UPI002FDC8E59